MLSGILENISVQDVKTVATFCVGFVVLVYMFKKSSKNNLPPGPTGLPIIGNVLQMMGSRRLTDIFKDWTQKYGSVFMIRVGGWKVVVLNKWNVVHEAFVVRRDDFAGRPNLQSIQSLLDRDGGQDIFLMDIGSVWKSHRRLAASAIRNCASGKHLEEFVQHSMNCVFEALAKEKGPVDMREHMAMLAFSLVFTVGFGKRLTYDDPFVVKFNDATREAAEMMGNGLPEDFLPFLKHFPSKTRDKFNEFLNGFLDTLRTNYFEAKATYNGENPSCLTHYLVHAQQMAMKDEEDAADLTDAHLYLTLFDMIGAGIDTMTYTLYWIIAHMSENLDIQEKMQQEIDSVCGSDIPTLDMKKHLRYTEAVIYESLRCEAVAPVGLPHATMCDTQVGGYDVPKGTWVLANITALHNDPDYFSDPEKFRPERFLDENGIPYRPTSYIPFSAGRRVCLGEVLAKNELMLTVPMLFQKYRFLPAEGEGYNGRSNVSGIFNMPKPFKVVLQDRQKLNSL